MRSIEVNCSAFGAVRFIGETLNCGADFFMDANCSRNELDTLIFLDSRGVSGNFTGSLIERLLERMTEGRRYLAICRPLELTTWATLYNFVTVNELHPPKLITNAGFVDFTPKKESVLVDAVSQVEALMGSNVSHTQVVEAYPTKNGEVIQLSSMNYTSAYKANIEFALRESDAIVINTPMVRPAACGVRVRPQSFFEGIDATNKFNRSLDGTRIIEIPEFDNTQTYDGVHYTTRGNQLIFDLVRKFV